MAQALTGTFHRTVDEGVARLERPLTALFATGIVGGLDVGIGVVALLLVEEQTGSRLLGALAFGIGFLALTLASSELFTENFLVPIATVVAKDAPWWTVPRLWIGTAVFNLVGGWIGMALAMVAFPELHATALRVADHANALGNMLGGLVFVTGLRLLQVGSSEVKREQERPKDEPREPEP